MAWARERTDSFSLAFDQFTGTGAGLGLTGMPGMPGGDEDFSLQRPNNDPATKAPPGNAAADRGLADPSVDQDED